MFDFIKELDNALWNDYLKRMHYLYFGTYMKKEQKKPINMFPSLRSIKNE